MGVYRVTKFALIEFRYLIEEKRLNDFKFLLFGPMISDENSTHFYL